MVTSFTAEGQDSMRNQNECPNNESSDIGALVKICSHSQTQQERPPPETIQFLNSCGLHSELTPQKPGQLLVSHDHSILNNQS